MQCEATFVNKMAKIRQETEAAIHEVSFQARFQVFHYVCIQFFVCYWYTVQQMVSFSRQTHGLSKLRGTEPRYYIYKTLSDYRGYQMR